MEHNYIAAILFFLPAGVANAFPPIANKIPVWNKWNTPVDFGKSWRGKRLTGDNKTWRGIASGTLAAGLTALLIAKLVPETIVNDHIFITGLLIGFGALIGDAVESCFKRQRGIKPGTSWRPWDQIDYIIGALVFVLPIAPLPLWAILTIIVVYFPGHFLFSYIGYKLGLKSAPI